MRHCCGSDQNRCCDARTADASPVLPRATSCKHSPAGWLASVLPAASFRVVRSSARAVDAGTAGRERPPLAMLAASANQSARLCAIDTVAASEAPKKAARVEADAITLTYQEVASGSRRGAGARPDIHTIHSIATGCVRADPAAARAHHKKGWPSTAWMRARRRRASAWRARTLRE